jgi:hypothetical protein
MDALNLSYCGNIIMCFKYFSQFNYLDLENLKVMKMNIAEVKAT